MKKFLLRRVLEPLIERVGTFGAAFLVGQGMSQDMAVDIQTALVALALFIIDLLVNQYQKQRFLKRKTIEHINEGSEIIADAIQERAFPPDFDQER